MPLEASIPFYRTLMQFDLEYQRLLHTKFRYSTGTMTSTHSPPSLPPTYYVTLFKNMPEVAPMCVYRAFSDNDPNLVNILRGIETLLKTAPSDTDELFKLASHRLPDMIIVTILDVKFLGLLQFHSKDDEAVRITSISWFFLWYLSFFFFLQDFLTATMLMSVFCIFLRAFQSRRNENNPVLMDCAHRILSFAPKFGQLFWEHRTLLRYDRERQNYANLGLIIKSPAFAIEVGDCMVSYILLNNFLK